ncbi:MAG: ComEC/Rec2 family competence protein [Dehalococcoidia bacterium]
MRLTLLGAAWAGGVCLGYFALDPLWLVILAAAAAGALGALRFSPPFGLATAVFLVAAVVRYGAEDGASGALPEEPLEGRFEALVTDEPQDNATRVSFAARITAGGDDGWQGKSVLVEVPAFLDVDYGDAFEGGGELVPLDREQPFDRHLAEEGLAGRWLYPEGFEVVSGGHAEWWREVLLDVRRWASDRIDRVLPEPSSALARGMLLGQREDIDSGLRRDLNAAGTSHLIAISGQNLVLLAGVVLIMGRRWLGPRWSALLAIGAVSAYALMLGAPPSIQRALLMSILFVLAPVFGRQPAGFGALALTFVVLTAWDPLVVHDLSFQLSLSATAGLIVLATPLAGAMSGALTLAEKGILRSLADAFGISVAATLATLPIVALSLDQVSLVGVLANFAVIALFAPMLLSALLAIPASLLPETVALVLAWPAWLLFEYFRAVSVAAAELPGAAVGAGGFGLAHAAAVYVALLGLRFALPARQEQREIKEGGVALAMGPALLAVGLVVANGVAWFPSAQADEAEMEVSFLNVGQGDAILVETPAGQRILIDGGPDPARLVRELDSELGFGSRRIDLLLLTHMAADHATGTLEVLERYDVEAVGWTGISDASVLAGEWAAVVEQSGAEVWELSAGDRVVVEDDIALEVLWPVDEGLRLKAENDLSLVVRLTHGDVSFLLTGDVEAAAEALLLASGIHLESDVLKVAHHGSETSTLPELLAASGADFAVITVGGSNQFGHPHERVLARLEEAGMVVLRTDEDGRVSFVSDGERVRRSD